MAKYILLIVSVAITAMQAYGCVPIGDPCTKNGEKCCASTNIDKPDSYCYGGDNSVVFYREYECRECDSDSCYDYIPEMNWYIQIAGVAVITGTAVQFVIGMILEFFKQAGVLPKPKYIPTESDQLFVFALPESDSKIFN